MRAVVHAVGWVAHGVALLGAAVALILMVPAVVAALLSLSAQQSLTPQPWKEVLAAQRVYDRLPTIAAEQLVHQLALSAREGDPGSGSAPAAIRGLTAPQAEAMLREVLPPEWLRTQTERVLDLLLADPAPAGPIPISLVDLKSRLAAGGAVRAYIALAKAQPPCTADQLRAWTEKVDLPSCRPPDDVLALATPAITDSLAAVARGLPDEVDLRDAFGERPASSTTGENGIDALRRTLRMALVLPFALAFVATVLAVRSVRAFLGWLGTPLVFGGSLAFAIGFELVPLAERATVALRTQVPAPFSPTLVAAVFGVAHGIAERVAASLTIESAAVTLVGVSMLLIAPLAKRPARTTARRVAPAPAAV